MSEKIYYYSTDIDDDRFKIETIWDIDNDGQWLAHDAAEDFYHNHDGQLYEWPRQISLHREDNGDAVATYRVKLDFEPTFSAELAAPNTPT